LKKFTTHSGSRIPTLFCFPQWFEYASFDVPTSTIENGERKLIINIGICN
jgi:hypothetical protein